ncbi:hypothetical protein PCANC_12275 [Puccinia coronata f. sp. avenae]|uniref:Uncharacterized protein n=1 Tax=Puccinia coronata f. sp. avenae TaxID=200324 RepID=A0A2N5SZ47_9BASI|nr:hypothetical protein PCANC_12275 [Puccinia coronata f. sp. avenae]
MSSVTQPLNGPDYSNKGLSTEQLIAALDQEPTMELDNLFRTDPPLPPDTGIAPSLVNSREASQALESTRLTPVPAPIERQGVSSLPFVENSSNQPALSLLQANSTPQGQTQALEMSEEAETAANILDGQWSLFLKARSSNDTSLMRTTLTQAHSTQLLLQRLVGFDDMMRLLDNWSAKKELDKLEAEMNAPKKSGPAPMILDKELSKGTPQDNPNIPGKNPEIKYLKLVPGGSNMPNAHLPPPPPPSYPPPLTNPLTTSHPPGNLPPFVSEMDIRSPPITQNQNSYYTPPHHLGYPHQPHQQPGYNNYHYYGQTPYQRPNNNNSWRGRGRNNWRRPRDTTSNMMEIGDFFVRAERALNAMQQRGRSRGFRHRGRGQNSNNPAYHQ